MKSVIEEINTGEEHRKCWDPGVATNWNLQGKAPCQRGTGVRIWKGDICSSGEVGACLEYSVLARRPVKASVARQGWVRGEIVGEEAREVRDSQCLWGHVDHWKGFGLALERRPSQGVNREVTWSDFFWSPWQLLRMEEKAQRQEQGHQLNVVMEERDDNSSALLSATRILRSAWTLGILCRQEQQDLLMGCMRDVRYKLEVTFTSILLTWEPQRMELPFPEMKKTMKKAPLGEKMGSWVLYTLGLRRLIQAEMTKEALGWMNLRTRREICARYTNLGRASALTVFNSKRLNEFTLGVNVDRKRRHPRTGSWGLQHEKTREMRRN